MGFRRKRQAELVAARAGINLAASVACFAALTEAHLPIFERHTTVTCFAASRHPKRAIFPIAGVVTGIGFRLTSAILKSFVFAAPVDLDGIVAATDREAAAHQNQNQNERFHGLSPLRRFWRVGRFLNPD